MDTFVLGIAWDQYTPAVEAQLARDLIALQSEATTQKTRLVVATESIEADPLLRALRIDRINSMVPASIIRTYKVHNSPQLNVRNDVDVIECDLSVEMAPKNINPQSEVPYDLQRGDRAIPNTLDLDSLPPTRRRGQVDPFFLQIWGP